MKRYNEPIVVEVDGNDVLAFIFRKRRHTITHIEEKWIAQSKWWSKEQKRVYFRVQTTSGLATIYQRVDIAQNLKEWYLEELFD